MPQGRNVGASDASGGGRAATDLSCSDPVDDRLVQPEDRFGLECEVVWVDVHVHAIFSTRRGRWFAWTGLRDGRSGKSQSPDWGNLGLPAYVKLCPVDDEFAQPFTHPYRR